MRSNSPRSKVQFAAALGPLPGTTKTVFLPFVFLACSTLGSKGHFGGITKELVVAESD